MKMKKWIGLVPLIIGGGIVASTVATTSTSCSGNKNYTFKTGAEVINYLKKHSVDVKQAHDFLPAGGNDDYVFIKDNVNFDFFINSALWSVLVLEWYNKDPVEEDHIDLNVNGDTAKVEVKHGDTEISATFRYSDQVVYFTLNGSAEDVFDLKKSYVANSHTITPSSIDVSGISSRNLVFFDISFSTLLPVFNGVPVFLSPCDWLNEKITWNNVA